VEPKKGGDTMQFVTEPKRLDILCQRGI